MEFSVHNLADLKPLAKALIGLTSGNTVFALYGNLGSGKTTLVQEICRQLGVTESMTSPTYSIVNEHSYNNKPLYHIDLYRLKSEEEAIQVGLEEYLFSGNLCFVEWPDHFENLLPEQHIKIFIRKLENDSRTIEVVSSLPQ